MFNKAILILLICGFFLSACASSDVSRDVIQVLTRRTKCRKLYDNATEGDFTDTYQNTSQATKGAVLGGAQGGNRVMSSSVGFIPGTAIGLILGASYGRYIDAHSNVQDQLENRGVNVIVLGDQVLIIVPSARLFNPMTSKINPSAYSTFTLIAAILIAYQNTSESQQPIRMIWVHIVSMLLCQNNKQKTWQNFF